MSKQTPFINDINVQNVRMQINRKNLSVPYHATVKEASGVLTDYDTFPYPRWFRGVYHSPQPIVAEREAGWRPRHDNCYRIQEPCSIQEPLQYPNHCFESACSTLYPCYPKYMSKWADRDALNLMLNNGCLVQYR